MARGKRVATVLLAIAIGVFLLLGAWTALAGVNDGDYSNYLDNGDFDSALSPYWSVTSGSSPAFSRITGSECVGGSGGCLRGTSGVSSSDDLVEQSFTIDATGQAGLSAQFKVSGFGGASSPVYVRLINPSGATVMTLRCEGPSDPCGSSWTGKSDTASITQTGVYRVEITADVQSFGTIYIDNIVVTVDGQGPPTPTPTPSPTPENTLLDRMVWGAGPECPTCSVQNAVGWTGGPINTRNGNLSYQETDLSVPVQGGALEFRRSYASQAVDVYTSTMGHGWTHNFDMRLHFEGNALIDTVELQAPGGSRLPFFDNLDGTYSPYPGVTAQLSRITATNPITTQYVVTAFNQMVYTFNADGNLIQQEDADGNVITFSYTGGKLTQAAQGTRSLTYAYDGDYLTSVTDNAGRSVELGYENGNLTVVTDTLGLATTHYYSATASPYLLTKVVDPTGVTVEETAYDAEGRAYRQWDGAGNLLADVDFTISNTHVITENGVVMTHTYDSRGTLVDSTFSCADGTTGCGSGTDKAYDDNFKANQVVDANGNATSLSWDTDGSNLEQVTDALSNTTSMVYDGLNNLTQVVNAWGLTTTYTYDNASFPTFRTSMTDALGNTTIYTPTVDGLLAAEEDPNGNVTTYSYNTFGQVTEVVQAAGTSEAITTTYAYDAVGRLQTTTETSVGESHTTLNVYDDGDRLMATIANWTGSNPALWQNNCDTTSGARDTDVCTRYGYDDAGRTISTTNTLGQTDLTFYDSAGRVEATVSNWDGSAYTGYSDLCNFASPDPEHNVCHLTGYDQFGRVVSMTNALGHVTRTFYDSLGRVAGTVENSVSVTALAQCAFPPASPDQDLCTIYEYDAVSNTIIVTDTVGRMTRTFYDELNRVEATVENWSGSITDPAQCAFPPMQPDADLCTTYEYDEVGNMTVVTDPLGHQTRTFNDELNRVEGTVQNWQAGFTLANCFDAGRDPHRDENVCTLYEYDEAGNQTVVTDAKEQKSHTVYDSANRPVVQVQNWDGVTAIGADGSGCADTATNPNASENLCSFTAYDALGRRASVTDVLGQVIEFAYDGLGRVVTTTRTLDGQPVQTSTSYNALGNRLSETDAEGHTTSYTYDSLNRLELITSHEGVTTSQTYNAAGWVLTSSDGLNHTTTNGYDDLGRLTSTTDLEGNTTEYEYDAAGNQTAMIDAEGVRTTYGYDELDRVTSVVENDTGDAQTDESNLLTQYAYDALGNRVDIVNARGYTVTHTVYDGLNRPISVQDALGNTTRYTYDLVGNRAVITDANGEVTNHDYDALNRLITTTYTADAVTVSYQYDAAGNRTEMVDDVGTTTYQYDDFYRLITVTNPFNAVVGYRYDDAGNRTQLIYPDSREVGYTYDGDNRLLQVTDWNAGVTGYQYDGAGRLITTTLPNGVTSVNTYDDANRLLSLRHEGSDSSLLAEYLYQLDGVGNRVAVTETVRAPDVVETIDAYIEQNGLLVLEAENGTATASASHDWQTQTAQTGYEGSGYSRALPDTGARYEETETASSPSLSWPIYNETGGTYSVWVRGMGPDAAGDSLHVGLDGAAPSSAADLTGFTNEWGWSKVTMGGGNASVDLSATGEHRLEAYMREDGLRVDRMLLVTDTNYIPTGLGPAESPFQTITETIPGGLGTTSISYQYDALYRLTDATYSGAITATFTYDYDSVGNMTAFTETVDAQTTSVTRSFDAANRLQTSTDAATGTTSYVYDANGNLTTVYPPGADAGNPVGALSYAYDQRNLIVNHEINPDGTAWALQAEYVYDGGSDRLQQVDYTGATPITTTYTNDSFGLTQVLVADDGTTQVYNLFGLDLISQDDGSEVRTLLVDGLGSVCQEMVGDVVETATTYTPYGEVLEQTGTSETVYGFTGEHQDSATGLLYLRARYYNSSLKTFMSRDQWAGASSTPQTINGWSYVENNPFNRVDLTGLSSSTCPTCGPDATGWLMREMAQHWRYGNEIVNKRTRMLRRAVVGTIVTPPFTPLPIMLFATERPFDELTRQFGPDDSPIGLIPVFEYYTSKEVVEDLGWLEYAVYGLAVDYSNVQYVPKSATCGTGGCAQFSPGAGQGRELVTLCGRCVDSSDIGNMMFGLGGNARGYPLTASYSAAASFNVLTDWNRELNAQGIGNLVDAYLDADGRGAIVGWLLGSTHAYANRTLFCQVINGLRGIGYNDAGSRTKVGQCEACTSAHVTGIRRSMGREIRENPSSLYTLGNGRSTIDDLEDKLLGIVGR